MRASSASSTCTRSPSIQEPAELREKIREVAALFIAAGIDPKHSSIMVQSSVPAHAELSWLLTCVTPMGWLQRMTQFKAKSEAQETVGDGILQYPVLMAADILLYQAAIVPVGDDQSQHLELTRDIAQRFNSLYGETFVMPATNMPTVGARVMGLDEPDKKMSKSAKGSGHAVALLDPPDQVRKKIMRATTDSNPAVDFDTMGEGVANLLSIYQAFSEWTDEQMRAHFTGLRYGDLKKQVAEMVAVSLEPIQKRYREIVAEPGYLDGILREGAARVTPIAGGTVELVKSRMGLYTPSPEQMPGTSSVSLRAYANLVRGNRNFRLLWTAQIVSEIGDWLYSVALYSLLLEQTGSARAVALAFVLQVLPHFFVAPAAGVVNDHASRKRVMMITDWARALVVLLMWFGQLPGFVWLLYLLLTLETVGWAMFEPARSSVIPNVTGDPQEQLVANTLSSMTWSFTLAIGSALGGLSAAVLGRGATFTLNSMSFLLSGWLISRMRFAEPHLESVEALHPRMLFDFTPVLDGIRYVCRDGRMLATLMVKTGLALMGTNWVLLPVLGERVFPFKHAAGGMYAMSLLMGCRGLGALLGPTIAARITGASERRLRLGILAGFTIGAIGYLCLGSAPALVFACLAVVFAHSGGSIAWVFSTNLLQTMTEDRFRGRVFSAEYALNTLLLSGVTWTVGFSIDRGAAPRHMAWITGLVLFIPAILWACALRLWKPLPLSDDGDFQAATKGL